MIVEKVIFSFITAFVLTFLAIPSIIAVARTKRLYDNPGDGRNNNINIPTLGGLAIFAGVIFSISFWADFSKCLNLQYIIAAITIVFFIGLKDDIIGLAPFKKGMGQLLAALVLVVWGDIRLSGFYGIFGVNELPYIVSVLFSIFTILVIINSFNMIDGINGLSASFGIISSFTFGIWFYLTEHYQFAIIAFSIVGSLLAFMRFNITPAKIFMGDTGSLLLGLILSVFAVKFIDFNGTLSGNFHIHSAPVVAMGILTIPLFDLLRIFIIRIINKKSPFKADRNHIHHQLLNLGISHNKVTVILSFISLIFIVTVFLLHNLGNFSLFFVIFIPTVVLSYLPYYFLRKKKLTKN